MESPSENKENTTRGCLTLNDKIYPVYEGHNTVGRNPDAVINIKNLNVSKHHAIITVVNQELHYISDFKSSNGTVLDREKLTPLRLYKLSNGSSIKFGDVFCTYKKLEDETNILNNVEESQQFSDNFYATATQEVDLPNIPDGINFNEMPTQVFSGKELSINEMPTQVFGVKDFSINEMPTQVHHFPGFNDESSNDSIDFVTMQKSTESQMFKCDKNSNSLIESDEEAETSHKKPTQTSSNSSQIQPVTINSKKIVDSDTEDESASQICPVRKSGNNVIDSDSEDTEEYVVNSSDQKSKYHISDDSETDIEGDDIKKNEDLNETDVIPESEIGGGQEDNSMASFRLELSESADCTNEDSFKKNKVSKKVLPQDHLYCQALTQTQDDLHRIEEHGSSKKENLNAPETVEENLHRNAETDLMVCEAPTEAFQNNEEKQSSQKEIKEEEGNIPEDDQKIKSDEKPEAGNLPEDNEKIKSDEKPEEGNVPEDDEKIKGDEKLEESNLPKDEKIKDDEKLDTSAVLSDNDSETTSSLPLPQDEARNENVFDQPTQQFNFDFINDAKVTDHDQNEDTKSAGNFQTEERLDQSGSTDNVKNQKVDEQMKNDDDIFLQPTQTLDFLASSKSGNTKKLEEKQLSSKDEDDIFLQSTQVIPTSDSVIPSSSKYEEDDIFLHPTQALEDIHGDEACLLQIEQSSDSKNDSLETTQTLESLLEDDVTKNADLTSRPSLLEKDDDDLLSPTQAMELLHGEDKISEMEKSLSSKNEEADDLFLPPTQALENLLSDAGPSSKNDGVFLPPNPFKEPSPVKKSIHKIQEDDDSFILPPTQAMEVLHEDGTHFNKVEDQLHEIFASQSLLCTQQLVDVLNTSREDDVIDDSIIQEETRRSLSLRKSAPLTEESVEEILAGDEKNKDVAELAVNRSSSRVKTYSTKNDKKDEEKVTEKQGKPSSSKEQSSDSENGAHGGNKSDKGAASNRRGRRKQTLEVCDETKEEHINVDKTVKETVKKGRKLKRNLIALDDEHEHKDKEDNNVQETKQAKGRLIQDRESSVESSTSELGTRRGRSRLQKENDGSRSCKDEDSEKKTESTVGAKKHDSEESGEGRRRRGRSTKSTLSDDRESGSESSQNDSQNSRSDGKSTKGRKTQINEDKKKDPSKTDSEKSEEKLRRGRSKSHDITKDQELRPNDNGENKRKGKKRQVANDKEADVDEDEGKKSTISNNERNRRGKSKQNSTNVNSRGSSDESNKGGDHSSNVEVNTRRGRRKQTIDEDKDKDKKEESQSSIESKGSGKSKQSQTNTRESSVESSKDSSQSSSNDGNSRRSKRNQNVNKDQTNKDKAADLEIQEIYTHEVKRRMGLRKQTLPEPDEPSNDEEEDTKTRGRKKLVAEIDKSADLTQNREETPEPATSRTKKASKRKQDGDEPPETPNKKKPENTISSKNFQAAPATPRKRGLKIPSYDSEEDFVTKVPKIETPTKTRQSARKKKNDGESSEEVITISSASSDKSVIVISSTPSVSSAKTPRRLSANSRRQKREEENVEEDKKQKTTRKASVAAIATPVLATPERSRRVLKPKVVFTMMDNPELESLIRTLGGSVVDTVDACTVLVTESVKRSLKLLCAVGQGKPICSPQWLHACKKTFSFVDPWDYLLIDKEAEKKWNFSLRESLKRSSAAKLLENYTFQIIVNNAADVLKGAIESSGGKCVSKNLAKCTTDHLIIVSSENNRAKYSKIVKQNQEIKVVEAEAIFDGTLRQEFKFDNFLLT